MYGGHGHHGHGDPGYFMGGYTDPSAMMYGAQQYTTTYQTAYPQPGYPQPGYPAAQPFVSAYPGTYPGVPQTPSTFAAYPGAQAPGYPYPDYSAASPNPAAPTPALTSNPSSAAMPQSPLSPSSSVTSSSSSSSSLYPQAPISSNPQQTHPRPPSDAASPAAWNPPAPADSAVSFLGFGGTPVRPSGDAPPPPVPPSDMSAYAAFAPPIGSGDFAAAAFLGMPTSGGSNPSVPSALLAAQPSPAAPIESTESFLARFNKIGKTNPADTIASFGANPSSSTSSAPTDSSLSSNSSNSLSNTSYAGYAAPSQDAPKYGGGAYAPSGAAAPPPQQQPPSSVSNAAAAYTAPSSGSSAEEMATFKKVQEAEARLAQLEEQQRAKLADIARREQELGEKQQQFLVREATFHQEKEREMRKIQQMQQEFENKLSQLQQREEQQRLKAEAETRILHEELAQQREMLSAAREKLLQDSSQAVAQRAQAQKEQADFAAAKARLEAQEQDMLRQRQQLETLSGQSAAALHSHRAELDRQAQMLQAEQQRLQAEQRRLETEAQAEKTRQRELARWQEQEMQRQMEELRLQSELMMKHQNEEKQNLIEQQNILRQQLQQQTLTLQKQEQTLLNRAREQEAQHQEAIRVFEIQRKQHEEALRVRDEELRRTHAELAEKAKQDPVAAQKLQQLQQELDSKARAIQKEREQLQAQQAQLQTALVQARQKNDADRVNLEREQENVQAKQNILRWEEKMNAASPISVAPPLPPRTSSAADRPVPPLPPRHSDGQPTTKVENVVFLQRTFRFWAQNRGLFKWWRLVSAYKQHESSRPDRIRYRNIMEIYTTEVSYIKDLQTIVAYYRAPMVSRLDKNPDALAIRRKDVANLFGPLDSIIQLSITLETRLEEALKVWPARTPNEVDSFFGVLLTMAPHIKMYSAYFNNFNISQQLLEKLNKSQSSSDFLKECQVNSRCPLDLPSLLIKPCQRPPRYELLVREVMKNTSQSHMDYGLIQRVYEAFQETNKEINAAKAHSEALSKMVSLSSQIANFPVPSGIVAPHRELLRETNIQVSSTKKAQSGSFYAFLFTDGILAVTKRSEVQKAFGALQYAYAWHILFSSTVITLNELNGVENMFRLQCGDPNSPEYILYTISCDDALAWVADIRKSLSVMNVGSRLSMQSSTQLPISTSQSRLSLPPGLN